MYVCVCVAVRDSWLARARVLWTGTIIIIRSERSSPRVGGRERSVKKLGEKKLFLKITYLHTVYVGSGVIARPQDAPRKNKGTYA